MALDPITRKEQIIAGKDLEPITRMEKFLKQFGGGGGGGSVPKPLTYDYMPEGYPTKSGWSIEWDGNTEGLVAVESGGTALYKVSDLTPTNDELIGSIVETSDGNKVEIISDYVVVISDDITTVGFLVVVKKDNATFTDTTFPQKGTYFERSTGRYTTKFSRQTITPMAKEFIPNILEINSIIMNSSTTDSTKKFKITVDDSGTISATEVTV